MRSSDETDVFRLFADELVRRAKSVVVARTLSIREQKKEWFYVVIQKYRWYS